MKLWATGQAVGQARMEARLGWHEKCRLYPAVMLFMVTSSTWACTLPHAATAQGSSCAPVFNFVLRKAAEARQFDAVVALLSAMRAANVEVDSGVAALVRVARVVAARVDPAVAALPRAAGWRAAKMAGPNCVFDACQPTAHLSSCLLQVMNAQAEPASPLAPGASAFSPTAPPSPGLPAPLPPMSPLAGMQPALSLEPAIGGAPAVFASLPGFAASKADRSPVGTPSLPPPPPSPSTPSAFAAAMPLGSPSPAPAFSLADANTLLEAMKVSLRACWITRTLPAAFV